MIPFNHNLNLSSIPLDRSYVDVRTYPRYLPTYLSIYLSIYLFHLILAIYQSTYLPTYLSIYLPTYLRAYPRYQAEGLDVPKIDFEDNQPVLDLIEGKNAAFASSEARGGASRGARNLRFGRGAGGGGGMAPPGILVLCDDEIRTPNGSDASFVNKCDQAHARDKTYITSSRALKGEYFLIFCLLNRAADPRFLNMGVCITCFRF